MAIFIIISGHYFANYIKNHSSQNIVKASWVKKHASKNLNSTNSLYPTQE